MAELIVPASNSDESIDEIIAEYHATIEEEAKDAGHVGYMARALIQAALPHSDPKSNEYIRQNGNFKLGIWSMEGCPFGSFPRVFLSFVTEEAVLRQNDIDPQKPVIVIGNNLTEFVEAMGFKMTGGKQGNITKVKKQMLRIMSCSISCKYRGDDDRTELKGIMPFTNADIYWGEAANPDQKRLWKSNLTLSPEFFQEIIQKPVPIRRSTIKGLKSSSLALDLYCWATYKNFYSRKESYIPWEALQNQFGSGYKETAEGRRNFKVKFTKGLRDVAVYYPEVTKFRIETKYLIYVPGMPDIIPKKILKPMM